MNFDEYGEVINGEDTYREIADLLTDISGLAGRKPVIIGWTDGKGTHFDILFVLGAEKFGTIQGGIRGSDLFVSIMRWGAFGFCVDHKDTDAGYYEEKLGNRGTFGPTAEPLAELINGVKKYL